MSNNPNGGNENYWPASSQQPPAHHYTHAQHQQLHHPLPQPVPQLLTQHLQQHPHSYAVPTAPVVPSSVAGYYQNVPSMVDTFTANPAVYPHPHGSQQHGDEYTDAYGQLIKVVYNPPHQPATGPGLMARPLDEATQNHHPGSNKQGYELFSNNSSFMLAAPGFGFTLHNPQQQQQQPQPPPQAPPATEHQQQQSSVGLSAQFASQAHGAGQPVLQTPVVPPTSPLSVDNANNNTSELISQLVGNWAPTISGTYGNGPSLINETAPGTTSPLLQNANHDPEANKGTDSPTKTGVQKSVVNPVPPTITGTAGSLPVSAVSSQPCPPKVCASRANAAAATTTSVAAVYNQQNDDNSAKLDQNVNKKQRIVAEVKPMRMSYSDVLSKNVSSGVGGAGVIGGAGVGVSMSGNGSASAAVVNGDGINAPPSMATNGSKQTLVNGANGNVNTATKTAGKRESKKASATNGSERKFGAANVITQKDRSNEGSSKKGDRMNGGGTGVAGSSAGLASDGGNGKTDSTTGSRQGQEKGKKSDKSTYRKDKGTARPIGMEGTDAGSLGKARRARRSDESELNGHQNGDDGALLNDETEEERADEFYEDDSEEYDQDSVESEAGAQLGNRGNANGQQQSTQFVYNVKKNTNGSNDTHIEKINPPRMATYRKGGGTSGRGTGAGSRTSSKQQQQQEKLAGLSSSGGKRSARSRKNQKYAFLEKLLLKWLEYTILAIHWLWSLVSDVVYLSLRLAWDYVLSGYQYCWQHARTLRQDFSKNSARPGAWFRGVWLAFDNRFEKDSRWAFWRRCRRQKPTLESTAGKTGTGTPHYKDGRLPSTADEAMSSLLNCKGKDAYSILGVSPECSQEQIRKHYKKIAVLVHPDKNKQPGAEEAFKVLQRSFELIGEPESRKEYDQSLAEALNAEKAWSEINDLLTQLHTKISEAANTISSCKIRHPAREVRFRTRSSRANRLHFNCQNVRMCLSFLFQGDIWAETTFLGFRWKYLAMMEGNVYDITEWANCQKGALSHLQPNSHIYTAFFLLTGCGMLCNFEFFSLSEPNLDDFLNNIYAGQNQQAASQNTSSRRRYLFRPPRIQGVLFPMAEEAIFEFLHSEIVNYTLTKENSKENDLSTLEYIGFTTGYRIIERLTREWPRFKDELDTMKFICTDFWSSIYRKQIDNLRTNHQGVYVLQDNAFRFLTRLSSGSQYLEHAPKEIASLMRLWNIQMNTPANHNPERPFWVVEMQNDEAARKLASRSMSLRCVFELWAHSGQGLQCFHQELRRHVESNQSLAVHFEVDKSFKITVETYNKHFTQKEKVEKIETMQYLPLNGPVNLKNPRRALLLH
ncbi:hypothetical protein ZHAS_00011962 [Anopheles sinensis]|uniref:J domain-containing protein n=1 Tax=Anopheles sinensis TaxID=74873 RepID=A0A084W1N3_ANOSI|nr:hypothetical protein ZHAS_00011962 [Anopheles sinensis]